MLLGVIAAEGEAELGRRRLDGNGTWEVGHLGPGRERTGVPCMPADILGREAEGDPHLGLGRVGGWATRALLRMPSDLPQVGIRRKIRSIPSQI